MSLNPDLLEAFLEHPTLAGISGLSLIIILIIFTLWLVSLFPA